MTTLLQVSNVSKVYKLGSALSGSKLTAVDDVSLEIPGDRGTILSVVGESGSGKTTLARMILRLVQPTSGSIRVAGTDATTRPRGRRDALNFRRLVQPVSQNPYETFSARRRVDSYLYATALRLKIARSRQEASRVIAEALTSVGLELGYVAGKYPRQFSGGELQRISIARTLISKPKLIIADEPVSMIDASMKMNIVNLFHELKDRYDIGFVYITHDLSTAYYLSDYVGIMYRGSIVEYGPAEHLFAAPVHPYTQLLLDSVPTVGVKWDQEEQSATRSPVEIVSSRAGGCKFADRCVHAREICAQPPPLVPLDHGGQALCFRPVDYRESAPIALSEPR